MSDHFTQDELTFSSTAQRLGINNTPGADIIVNLQVLMDGLEQVRTLLGYAMHIDSGYRCPNLNAKIGGAPNSAHMYGFAADFICPEFGTPLAIVNAIVASDIRFDQCIQEGTWVHISFAPAMRRRVLTAHFGPDGTTYSQGV